MAYLTHNAPAAEDKPDWKAHFARLRKEKGKVKRLDLLREFEEKRRRLKAREFELGDPP